MSAEFVPFFAPQPGRSEAPQSFSPLAAKVSPSLSTAHPCANPSAEVKVDLKRDGGGRISQIRLQCRCGEVIEIDCEY
jgi:hypothetical protein